MLSKRLLNGKQMGAGWEKDGREMGERWERDGRKMGAGWEGKIPIYKNCMQNSEFSHKFAIIKTLPHKVRAYIISIFIFISCFASAQQWHHQNPVPSAEDYNDIFFTSPD